MKKTFSPIRLGVNVDHVATLRQARHTRYPDPVHAALVAEQSGADLITMHLREDRRHIQDRDIVHAKAMLQTRLNFEMAVTEEMLSFAEQIRPQDACLVPEKRQELTTEGGLDVIGQFEIIQRACERLSRVDIKVSLFIDPDLPQIAAAHKVGAPVIEIHTGRYAEATTEHEQAHELARIIQAVEYADSLDLQVNAGHGLHYYNVAAIAALPAICELNIGHAIVARSVFDGMATAVREMKRLMVEAKESGLRKIQD